MIRTRLELQNILEEILGSREVYFQAPESIRMSYPSIVYSLNEIPQKYADNKPYKRDYNYTITLMHEDPDNDIVDKLLDRFDYIKLNRTFAVQGLNNYVFSLYYKNEKEIN